MSDTVLALTIFALTTICVTCFGVYFLRPDIFKKTRFRERYHRLAAFNFDLRMFKEIEEGKKWKRTVEKTLLEIDEKQRSFSRDTSKPNLVSKMRQAGLFWTKRDYLSICLGTGFILFVGLWAFNLSIILAAILAIAGGIGLPYATVAHLRGRRFKRFSIEFTNGVDMMARGLKSGLPVGECIKIVSNETAEPVRSEFKQLSQDLALGLPMEISIHRFADRVPLHETSYFATVIGSQSKTGGSLSEALTNLSKILRDRRNMREKVRALSSEAIASATIIGSIPFIVGGIVFFASPDYLALLFQTRAGLITLILSGLWMMIGIVIIYKMVHFEF